MKECILIASEEAVGRGARRQPEWFLHAFDKLIPVIKEKDKMHAAFLGAVGRAAVGAKKRFRKAQRAVRDMVAKAKEDWICEVACRAESASRDGHVRWRCLKQLRGCSRGRTPRRQNAILDRNGELVCDLDRVRERWCQHFNSVLNIPSHFSDDVVDNYPHLTTRFDLDNPPSMEELVKAIERLKMNKAGGKTELLPELLLYANDELWNRLLLVIQDMWENGNVVGDWRDAIIVPIPKKGI